MALIVEEIRKDREKGAKLLENEYKAGLMSLARRFCADESDAEELVNRTFAIVIERIDSYLEQSAFFGWMSRILINCYSKDVRRKSNEIEFCDAELPEDAQDEDASARVFREVDASILRDAIDRLPKDMKQTLLMHYFMDMPVREVAKVLSVPSGTIMWRLHYARKILGAKLGASLKKPVVALVAAALFLMVGVAAVVGVVAEMGEIREAEPASQDVMPASTGMESADKDVGDGALGITRPTNDDDQLMTTSTQKEETTMQTTSIDGLFRKALRSLAAIATTATMASAPAVGSTAEWTGEGANALNSAAYVKVMENTGPLAGTWSLTGITAWNGAAQVAFACVSNRPYAAAYSGSAQGALPAGNYVHQLSVFNQWDGSRTRSYRVQLAQPVGGNDIYARVTAVTVSQEGVNLVDYPDIRDFKDDATKIAVSYIAASDLANFPVTKLKFKKQSGYLESEGDAFISLGHCAGPNTRIEVDFELTEVTVGNIPFGSYGDSSTGNPQFELFISYSSQSDQRPRYSWRFSGANFALQSMNCDLADCDRHVISFDATTRTYTSGSYTYTFNNPMLNKKSACPLSVFGRGVTSAATKPEHFGGATKVRVYGVNIYESGMLVKCFVPCVRGGIPGLIDTCNNAFVTGVDVSKVKHGGDIATIKDDPYVATSVNDVYGGTVVGERIYLNTGYYVKKNARVELDMAPLTPPWTTANPYGNHLFMHAQGPNKQYMYIINLNQPSASPTASPLYWKIGTKEDTAGDIQFSYATDIRRTYTFNSNTFQVVTAGYTNLTRTATAAQSIQNDLSTYPLHLASYSAADGSTTAAGLHAPMKIYGLKIFEDNVLVKDFKPFVTNGVPGLIDALNPSDMRFFTTYGGGSKGTNLVAEVGGNLDSHTSVRECEAYLEFPETGSGIDTGYSVGRDSCIEADLSLWKAGIGSQELINQDAGSDSCYVAFTSAGGTKQIWFKYADTAGNTAATIYTVNDRTQFFADRHMGNLTIKRGDAELYNKAMDANYACTRAGGSQTLKIGRSNAAMRLYSFKIYEYVNDVKTPVRDFVPCVTNGAAGLYDLCESKFYPLSGGKVSGKTAVGADEFVTRPQPTRIEVGGTGTLSCFSAAAKSYEWYVDGEKINGETNETLTIDWTRQKPYVRTYSVVPVYEVFGESVRGKAAEATVEFAVMGMILIIR